MTDEIMLPDIRLLGEVDIQEMRDGADASQNRKCDQASLVIRCAANIKPEKVDWIWPSRIARGKHIVIAGNPGTGKSQLCLDIAARITTGGEWPCGEGRARQGSVIILSAEDGPADTIIPRLRANGTEMSRIQIVSAVDDPRGSVRTFNLQRDIHALENEIAMIGDVSLVIIDPISSYMGNLDSHNNTDVRRVLEPLSTMAERMNVAVLSVTHLSKGGGRQAISRVIGSIGFVGASRAAFLVIDDKEVGGRRLFLPIKSNLAALPPGLAFRIAQYQLEEGIIAPALAWDAEAVQISADEALAAASDGPRRTATTDAIDFLQEILAGGPMPTKEVERLAYERGLTGKPLRNAKAKLAIVSDREGFGRDAQYWWSLPEAT